MNICCVITTINSPTAAMQSWLYHLPVIVVPDRKTPLADYAQTAYDLIGIADNYNIDSLPWNHYSRKNLGYLYAASKGYDYILDTDDDTFCANDKIYEWIQSRLCYVRNTNGSPFVNIYMHRLSGGSTFIWPRGYPLESLKYSDVVYDIRKIDCNFKLGIIQYLIDGDTDVDAIHRLIYGVKDIKFDKNNTLDIVNFGDFCPFNSQLTLFNKSCFPALYLPHTVTFRFTDILRGIVAKRVLDKHGLGMSFGDSIGYQVRNPHDYLKDFESEIPCYLRVNEIWNELSDIDGSNVSESILYSYRKLNSLKIVETTEVKTLEIWLDCMSRYI